MIMQHTLAAVFNNPIEAQQACDALASAGFSRNEMHISQNDDIERPADALLDEDAERDSDSPGATVRSFFSEIFGPARRTDAELYAEAVRRGNVVLTINVPEDDLLDQVTDVLDQYHPIDIDEQASQWKSGGWAAPELMRQSSSEDAAQSQKIILPAGGIGSAQLRQEQGDSHTASMQQDSSSETQQASFIHEDATHAFPRQDEPLKKQADVDLRGLFDTADQSASPAQDTMRNTQIDIEDLPGTPDLFGATAEADRERDDAYYKDHWNKNYADSGGKYEDYAPAYKHGALLAGSDQYKGRQWDEAESDVKSDWASKNPNSTWEKIKSAVRHGWESMTNRVNS
jgi:hypothetical protein